ncbi:MAG: hypothetical protein AAF790_12340 [Planctomycetota bacterium]
MKQRRRSHSRPDGFTIIVVMTLIVVAGSLTASWTMEAMRRRQATDRLHQQAQADWLMHAALGRAAAQLRQDPGYTGEVWAIGAEAFKPQAAGVAPVGPVGPVGPVAFDAEAAIEVQRVGDALKVTCRVRMPPGEARATQLTRTLTLDPPADPAQGAPR